MLIDRVKNRQPNIFNLKKPDDESGFLKVSSNFSRMLPEFFRLTRLLLEASLLKYSSTAPRLLELIGIDERQVKIAMQSNSRINIELELELFLALTELKDSFMRAQLVN